MQSTDTAAKSRTRADPFWSVMIPVYRPRAEYLFATLESVLSQRTDSDSISLHVVDDCTPETNVETLVRSRFGTAVTVSRTPRNLGLAGAWNHCVESATGTWVHILHQDDLVYPGFYTELRGLAEQFPGAGAVFCRHAFIDALGSRTRVSDLENDRPGVLPDWAYRETVLQRVQCAAIAVKRSVYAEVGGFRTDLPYCLDWEMWARIALVFPFAYSPSILAAYRVHAGSETSRLARTALVISDRIKAFTMIVQRLPAERRDDAYRAFTMELTSALSHHVDACCHARIYEGAIRAIRAVLELPLQPEERRRCVAQLRKARRARILGSVREWVRYIRLRTRISSTAT